MSSLQTFRKRMKVEARRWDGEGTTLSDLVNAFGYEEAPNFGAYCRADATTVFYFCRYAPDEPIALFRSNGHKGFLRKGQWLARHLESDTPFVMHDDDFNRIYEE